MIAYATKYKIYANPYDFCEYEVLNELRDLSNRTNDNCLYHCRFLFECDEIPVCSTVSESLKYQERVLLAPNEPILMRATYSGSKSVHMVVEFSKEYESLCRDNYKAIWHWLNKNYFEGYADAQCANPARLTRRPGAFREDKNRCQTLLYNGHNYFDNPDAIKELQRHLRALNCLPKSDVKLPKTTKSHDGLCSTYSVVTRYLGKSFPNTTGNGVSSKWLYAAIACCMKYRDNTTLNRVLAKARAEKWADTELNRIIKSLEK